MQNVVPGRFIVPQFPHRSIGTSPACIVGGGEAAGGGGAVAPSCGAAAVAGIPGGVDPSGEAHPTAAGVSPIVTMLRASSPLFPDELIVT